MAVLPTGIGPVTGYNIERSLRFNSADSAYLNRTCGTPTDNAKFTWSCWVKRTTLGTDQIVIGGYENSTNRGAVIFTSSDNLLVYRMVSSSGVNLRVTNAVFRDVGAWYHVVIVFDSNNATVANRVRVYVNGIEQTYSTSNDPGSGSGMYINRSATLNTIGQNGGSAGYLNGYMTEINFIDGQALTPSSFGETDSATGVWKPKAYSGTYGNNGFYLKFADNSGTTSTTLGKDSSGNGNNWTPNNFSVTAGAGNDSLVDSPTNYGTDTGVGGTVRGNYCTWNPLKNSTTLSDGNLRSFNSSTTQWLGVVGTFGMTSGKWYWEYTPTVAATVIVGLANSSYSTGGHPGSDANSWGYYSANGNKYFNNSGTSYGATYTANDVIGVAFDADAGTLTFYKNGVSQGTAYSSLTSGPYFPAVGVLNSQILFINAGQRPFAYTAPSGFKALCTQNLPTPTIGATSTTQANDYFDVKTWSGNSSTQSIALEFAPGLIWNKSRSGAAGHAWWDVLRGTGAQISSSETNAESTGYNAITSFSNNAISLGADNTGTSNGRTNETGRTYVGWVWNAGGSTVTNTSGTISAQVRANTTSGFSIVTYTGTGSNATVGHGLGVAPSMVIVKNRTNAGQFWAVGHSSLTSWANGVYLNSTAGQASATTLFNSTAPTSTVFSVGTSGDTNGNTHNMVAYCFAPVAGYSAFGSYTGNGSTDGTFVYTGFRPRYVLTKEVSASGNEWFIWDSARDTYNQMQNEIFANKADAENATGWTFQPYIDFTSNGFKLRSTNTHINGSGSTLIYAAFAEHPFKYSLAR